jgi:hypothetical protein
VWMCNCKALYSEFHGGAEGVNSLFLPMYFVENKKSKKGSNGELLIKLPNICKLYAKK